MTYYKLSKAQKEEIRRLTQRANRRILGAHKQYAKAGKEIAPREVTGGIQTKDQWETQKNPLSRSTRFSSEKEYKDRMKFLRSFDRGPASRPTMTQYTKIQKTKVKTAVKHTLGVDPGEKLQRHLKDLTGPELSEFWQRFENNAARMGPNYDSDKVLMDTMEEFFGEDIENLLELEG